MSSAVSGVVLAAGASSRFRGVKQLLELEGRPLARRVVEAALGSRLAEVIVVLGHASDRVTRTLEGLKVRIVDNPDYRLGQSTSVVAGLSQVMPNAAAAVFMPADQPLLSSHLIDRLIDVHQEGGKIGVPVYDGRRGAPVLFDRGFFAELKDLEGDAGGRNLLPRYAAQIVEVRVEDPRELADIDTRDDLRRFEQMAGLA